MATSLIAPLGFDCASAVPLVAVFWPLAAARGSDKTSCIEPVEIDKAVNIFDRFSAFLPDFGAAL